MLRQSANFWGAASAPTAQPKFTYYFDQACRMGRHCFASVAGRLPKVPQHTCMHLHCGKYSTIDRKTEVTNKLLLGMK
jgi:hypothetical protein